MAFIFHKPWGHQVSRYATGVQLLNLIIPCTLLFPQYLWDIFGQCFVRVGMRLKCDWSYSNIIRCRRYCKNKKIVSLTEEDNDEKRK